MVHYKVVYFDSRGVAEVARLILHHAGVDFNDQRVTHAEWPGELKAKAPFGKLPWLEVDGKKLPENFAICRYLARKFGLAGKDDWEQAWVDAIAHSFKDVQSEIRPYFLASHKEDDDKDKLLEEVFKPNVEKFLPQAEKFLKDAGSGFLVKGGYTWVDFLFAEAFTTFENIVPGSISKNKEIWAYKERVHNIPKIKDYVASRKVTRF